MFIFSKFYRKTLKLKLISKGAEMRREFLINFHVLIPPTERTSLIRNWAFFPLSLLVLRKSIKNFRRSREHHKSGKTEDSDQEFSEANCHCHGDGCDSVIHDLGQNYNAADLAFYDTMAENQDYYESQGKGWNSSTRLSAVSLVT